ncbi:MAG: nuclear transport factor 2 family protein [Actinomycetota bacterium]
MSRQIPAGELQAAKAVVLDHLAAMEKATSAGHHVEQIVDDLRAALRSATTDDYRWRGMYPFYEQDGADAVTDRFWGPLVRSFSSLTRRPDIFLAGANDAAEDSRDANDESSVWVCQMGHLFGLFDRPWLDIPPTNRITTIRYAEFHRVAGGAIAETAFFFDLVDMMTQAGHNPLPPQTGASFVYPGPKTHDGLQLGQNDPAAGRETMELVNRMVEDLSTANRVAAESGGDRMPRDVLATTWHEDMIWYGPAGIGATYTIDRYQQQHQYPFRFHLADKVFNGHVARFAEGDYACFFGWSNLTNRPTGGFLGLPSSSPADMRVVDVYRRSGNKLAENWVLIDLPHWLSMQGLDVLARMRQLLGKELI